MRTTQSIPYTDSLANCLAAIYAEAKKDGDLDDTWNTVYFDGEKYTCFADLPREVQGTCAINSDWQKFFDVNIFDGPEHGDGSEGSYRWGVYALEISSGVRPGVYSFAAEGIEPSIQTDTSSVLLSGSFDSDGNPFEDLDVS